MSSFVFDELIDAEGSHLDYDKSLLWIWHADKIPPHIGLSTKGKYFSLKANGKDESVDVDSVVLLVYKKKIQTLCIELNVYLDLDELISVFDKFEMTVPFETTCLKPIKRALKNNDATQLIDLLFYLEENSLITKTYGFHLPSHFNSIKEYTLDDINERLVRLNKK